MFNLKALQEREGELLDQAEAIASVAQAEKRDLSVDEQKEIDDILDVQIPKVQKDIARAQKIEDEKLRLAGERVTNREKLPGGGNQRPTHGPGSDPSASKLDLPLSARIMIPTQCRFRHSRLKSYSGQHAEERAFIAGMFALATLFQHEESAKWCAEHGIDVRYRAGQVGKDNSLGGYLVPDEMERSIIDLREQFGVFRRESNVVPMAGDTKTQPRRIGGLEAYFEGEGEEGTESEKRWDQIKLVAKKIMALSRFSSEIDEDAIISLGDDLTAEIAYAFALKEDQCGFLGDGTSTYGGITGVVNALNAGSIIVAASTHTSVESLDNDDYNKVIGALPDFTGINPKWYVHKVVWANSMQSIADAAGGNTMEHIAGQQRRTFKGYEVITVNVLNKTLGADAETIKVLFGDLRMGTTFGNRRGISIMLSDHVHFTSDQIAIRGTQRFDIVVHSKGTDTEPGAILALQTAAS